MRNILDFAIKKITCFPRSALLAYTSNLLGGISMQSFINILSPPNRQKCASTSVLSYHSRSESTQQNKLTSKKINHRANKKPKKWKMFLRFRDPYQINCERDEFWQWDDNIILCPFPTEGREIVSLSLSHTHTLSLSLSHTPSLSLTHTHTLSLSYTHTHTYTPSLSYTHTYTLSLSLTHTPSLTLVQLIDWSVIYQ